MRRIITSLIRKTYQLEWLGNSMILKQCHLDRILQVPDKLRYHIVISVLVIVLVIVLAVGRAIRQVLELAASSVSSIVDLAILWSESSGMNRQLLSKKVRGKRRTSFYVGICTICGTMMHFLWKLIWLKFLTFSNTTHHLIVDKLPCVICFHSMKGWIAWRREAWEHR